jgi:hypothetical protein
MSDRSQTHSHEPAGGEDDSSTEREGDDSHLHEDQKSPASKAAQADDPSNANSDDATKTQDLAKAGRPGFDPNAGQE